MKLRWMGHMERIDASHVPKCLTVSRPVKGIRSVGDQKWRWNDVVASDLKRGDLLEDWRETAQDREAWRSMVEDAMASINEQVAVEQ